jgi:hypothetical protein
MSWRGFGALELGKSSAAGFSKVIAALVEADRFTDLSSLRVTIRA